jgi:hypothetical protein
MQQATSQRWSMLFLFTMLSFNRLCAGVVRTADTEQIIAQLSDKGFEVSMTLQLARLEEEVYPRIHGMVFNPKDGLVKKLPVNFIKRVGSLDDIYGLYEQ